MDVVNAFSKLPGAGGGSEVGHGQSFQTVYEQQAGGDMSVFNMSPVLDRLGSQEISITPKCLLDNRMHVHVRTPDGNVEFWLEENGVPRVSIKEKDVSLSERKTRKIFDYVNDKKADYILEWINRATGAKFLETQRNLVRWRALAKKAGYIKEDNLKKQENENNNKNYVEM